MTLSDSEFAYDDCYKTFDKAAESKRGIRVEFDDFKTANYFRMRCHQARKIRRQKNAKVYPDPEHALHNRSEYDPYMITIESLGEQIYLYFRKMTLIPGKVEDLEDVEDTALLEYEEVRSLPAPTQPMHDHEDIAEEEPETPTKLFVPVGRRL